MQNSVADAMDVLRQALQAEAGDLRKQIAEVEDLLHKLGAPVASKEPKPKEPPAPQKKKLPAPKRKRAKPDGASIRDRVRRALADGKARESVAIERLLPNAKRSSVRSALNALVGTGVLTAIGEPGRRLYRVALTAPPLPTTPRAKKKKPLKSKPAEPTKRAPGALRDLIFQFLKSKPAGGTAQEIFSWVKARRGTPRGSLSFALWSMRKSGLLSGTESTAPMQRGGRRFVYTMPGRRS